MTTVPEPEYFYRNYADVMGFAGDYSLCDSCGHSSSYTVGVYTPESDIRYEYENGVYYDEDGEVVDDETLLEIEAASKFESIVYVSDGISCFGGPEVTVPVSKFREWFDNGSWVKRDFAQYNVATDDLFAAVDKADADFKDS